MSRDRPNDLESRVDDLSRRLISIERRLAALESPAPSPAPVRPVAATEGTTADVEEDEPKAAARAETLPLIGRTLLVLAGAFLLRVVTESGALPRGAGMTLGLAYAFAWLVLADRTARRGLTTSATFHGLAAAIIAFPLVWEATVKFDLFPLPVGVAILLAVAAAGLLLASWRRLDRVAWVMALAAVATALALGVATKAMVLFVVPVLVLGLATLWLGYFRGWTNLGWTVAAIADTSVLFLGTMVLAGRAERVWEVVHPESVVTAQLALVLIYCGSLGARTLAHRIDVGIAEIVQGAAALVVGLGGAVAVSHASGYGRGALGAVAALLAVGCYAAAFAFIDRHSTGRRNFIFYTTLALVFTLVALETLVSGAAFLWTVSILALLTAWIGAVRERATLTLHGAVYVVVAAVGSGLLALAMEAMVASGAPAVGRLTVPVLLALAASGVCAWLHVATHGRTWGGFSRAPKLVVMIVAILGVDAVLVILGAALLPRAEESTVDPAALAAWRTGVLAVTALFLAWVNRFPRFMEARWLVYPLLVVGGAKLLLEDVAAGSAATLVLSFALYGGALIAAPRLVARRK